jgi:hypothetical protein
VSGKLIGWAFDVEGLSPSQKLVLLGLADNADRGGICWPSQAELVEKTGLAERTVREHLNLFEDRGLIAKEPRLKIKGRGRASDIYRLAGGDDQPATDGRPTGNSQHDQPATDNTPLIEEPPKEPPKNQKRVGKKVVSDTELALAAAVVSLFNSYAGTGLSVYAHLTPIFGRNPEKPDYTETHHRKIIEAVFAGEHWWSGAPTPRIIYGNAGIFEQSIELARAATKKASPASFANAEAARIKAEQEAD